jgi:glycosyltransferase involved in cell wall biosynthesis
MIEQVPLVSIGLPVYNGATTVERAIDSLLAQDFKNFELIIADDGSVDATPELCEKYAAQNPRIRYSRNDRNLGAHANLQRVVDQARGRYFLYASQDDIWAECFLSRMIDALEYPPGAIAAMCAYRVIYPDGEDGGTIRIPPEDWPQRQGPFANAIAVFSKRGRRMRPLKTNNFIHGLIRTDAFRDCLRSLPEIFVNERQLVCLLALAGRLVQVDELLFVKQKARQTLFERRPHDPLVLKRRSVRFPHIDYVASLYIAVMRSDIVPLWRKPYVIPISVAFLWETIGLTTYARLLGALKRILHPALFSALQRLRGRG